MPFSFCIFSQFPHAFMDALHCLAIFIGNAQVHFQELIGHTLLATKVCDF